MNWSLPCGIFNENYKKDMAFIRTRVRWFILFFLLILLATFPHFVDEYFVRVAILIAINIIVVLGLSVITGYAGQISLGHAGFVAIGAYCSGILVYYYSVPFWFSVPISALISGLVGSVLLLPALRLRGFYVALATVSAQFIISWGLTRLPWTGSSALTTHPAPELMGIDFGQMRNYYYIVMVCLLFCTYFVKNLSRTHVGRAWIAIRDNDLAAEILGISLFKYKVWAFFIGTSLAGLAGALQAHFTCSIHAEFFSLNESIWYLGYLIVGGLGTVIGPWAGTILFMGLNEILVFGMGAVASIAIVSATYFIMIKEILFGLIFVLLVVLEPRGFAHRWELFQNWYRIFPFKY